MGGEGEGRLGPIAEVRSCGRHTLVDVINDIPVYGDSPGLLAHVFVH